MSCGGSEPREAEAGGGCCSSGHATVAHTQRRQGSGNPRHGQPYDGQRKDLLIRLNSRSKERLELEKGKQQKPRGG